MKILRLFIYHLNHICSIQ